MLTNPLEICKIYLKEEIKIILRTGEEMKGNLLSYDEHFNILIENIDNLTFIRGENIICIGQ